MPVRAASSAAASRIPADLNDHDAIVFSQDASADERGFHVSGTLERVRLNPRLIVNAAGLALAAKVRAFVDFAVDRLIARLR